VVISAQRVVLVNLCNNINGTIYLIEEMNVLTPPLLCNPEDGDFHIAVNSPCAPENNGWGELIGAFHVECDSLLMKTWYVAENGSDLNDGETVETPFRTIQHAIDLAIDGEMVLVMPGTYQITIIRMILSILGQQR